MNAIPYYHAPGYLLLYSSRISLAAKNCLTAQAKTSSGAMTIQNINLNLFQRAFHGFGAGTLGCTEVQAHIIMVEEQLQTIPNKVRCNGVSRLGSVSARSTNTGAAWTLRSKWNRKYTSTIGSYEGMARGGCLSCYCRYFIVTSLQARQC